MTTDAASPSWCYWWGTIDLVVAGYGGDSAQFRIQLEPLTARTGTVTKQSWQEAGGWIFAVCKTYNPGQIPGIEAKLMTLPGLCLRIKLKSTLGWIITAFAQGQECLTYRHDFSLLHPRQLDPAYITNLSKAYEGEFEAYLEDYELDLPPELQAQWRSLPFVESHRHCMSWYRQTCQDAADRLTALFHQHRVPCDRHHLTAILTGEACTPSELEWYVGNLPRCLTAIGLGEVFWNWQQELDGYSKF